MEYHVISLAMIVILIVNLFEVERKAEIVGKPLTSLLRCVLCVRGQILFYCELRAVEADVEGAQERRFTKGQGLLRKEGPPKISYFVAKLSIVSIYALFERLS